ncbi:hypothetical protein [Rhodococcus sp. ACS1]|uniref:hypothetical protein n=1 Tax=Rhodococcus sp. ACS1 TaxID=2028570 RepID=UPI00117A1377|nr:hypothetical protein [Rhodococcus sp. ACS1]
MYKSGRDCDGWHNGGAYAFRDNFSAYIDAASSLGMKLMSGLPLIHVDEDSWQVSTEEGYDACRIDYEYEGFEDGQWTVDRSSQAVDPDVACDCETLHCKGHYVSWNGRTDVNVARDPNTRQRARELAKKKVAEAAERVAEISSELNDRLA